VAIAGLIHPSKLRDRKSRSGEEAAELHLLAKGDQIRRRCQLELLVSPERSGDADARLHFVEDESGSGLCRETLYRSVKRCARVPIPPLRLYRFDNDGGHATGARLEDATELVDGSLLRARILAGKTRQRKSVRGKGCGWPGERRQIRFVDDLAVGRRKGSQ